jgi:hypothetical protein
MIFVVDSVLAAVRADQLGPQLTSEDALHLAVFSQQLRTWKGDRGGRLGKNRGLKGTAWNGDRSVVQFSTVQYSAVQYSAVQHG